MIDDRVLIRGKGRRGVGTTDRDGRCGGERE